MGYILWSLLWPPVWACIWNCRKLKGRPWRMPSFWEAWTYGGGGVALGGILGPDWPQLVIGIAQVVLGAICWWLSRRKRKRSAKLIGAKSRALLAAVVAKMREAAKPRPVFRPVPGGAR